MSHLFGDLLTQHLHRKHGLSQAKLAAGILQPPSIISEMCQGKRLTGPQARQRVTAIIGWLQQQGALTTLDEANALLNTAGMAPLQQAGATEAILIQRLRATPGQNRIQPTSELPHSPLATRNSQLTAPRHNLPVQLTPFIGRAAQIAQLVQLLPTRRLLTLTGAGGVGKTRLALEVATRLGVAFSDGVWFVDLAPLTNPDAIPQRILDLWRVPEQPERSPLEMLTTYLHSKQALLILDNCEHLLDACAVLAETLLQQCPHLALLATSRERLNLRAELPWRVPSLTRPHANGNSAAALTSPLTPTTLSGFEAVALFVERVHRHQPSFALTSANAPAVAHICSRLDGIPLALEMAAARVHVFTVEELAARLDGVFDARFQLLTSGARTAPFRHQTLRATLEWSYNLLTGAEQRLLTYLSVFHGGWTVAAAEAVTGATLDLLAQLVNKSLVIADQRAGQTRYRLLETVRQFAAEQLAVNEQEQHQVQQEHSRYYLNLLSTQEERLQSPQQRTALDLLRADFANISTAWQWAVAQHEFDLLGPAIHALFLYCDIPGSYRTGIALFGRVVAALLATTAGTITTQSTLQPLWGQLLVRLGACEVRLSNIAQGEQHLRDVLIFAVADRERALSLLYLGLATTDRGDLTLAHTHLQESFAISQRCGNLAGMAAVLHLLTNGASDYPEACRQCAESLALWRQIGRPDQIATVMNFLAWNTWCVGDYPAAQAYWREGLALCEQLGMLSERAWALSCLGNAAWVDGDLVFAEQCVREALAIYTDLGIQHMIGACKADLSWVLAHVGQVEQAIALAQEAVAINRAVNVQMHLALSLNYLGAAFLAAGDAKAARNALVEAVQRAWAHGYLFNLMNAFYYVAELLILESHTPDRPGALERQTLAVTALSCVRTQVATWHFFKDKAAHLQAEIEGALPAEVRAAAIVRGQSCTLAEMVSTLLDPNSQDQN